MARLILIRHGESVANAERRFTHGPHEPLSRKGREEALARARRIATLYDPVALYASPFVRALETARVIGSVLGLEPVIVEALQEQDFGRLRGQAYETVRSDPTWHTDRWRFRPPEGETLEEVFHRVGPALDAIADRHLGQQVVVVSHGGVMAALHAWTTVRRVEGLPPISANAAGWVIDRRGAGYADLALLDPDEARSAILG
jgi:broad specificity phosphatase PhoE